LRDASRKTKQGAILLSRVYGEWPAPASHSEYACARSAFLARSGPLPGALAAFLLARTVLLLLLLRTLLVLVLLLALLVLLVLLLLLVLLALALLVGLLVHYWLLVHGHCRQSEPKRRI
jgi:hypothetical protein